MLKLFLSTSGGTQIFIFFFSILLSYSTFSIDAKANSNLEQNILNKNNKAINIQSTPVPTQKNKTKIKSQSKPQTKVKKSILKEKSLPEPETSTSDDLDLPILPIIIPKDAAETLYPKAIGEDLSELVLKLSNRIDSFFGEERPDDDQNGSTLRVVPSFVFYDHAPTIFELGINLNLKLRNLEAKAKKLETTIREGLLPEKIINPNAGKTPKEIALEKAKEEAQSWHYNIESKLVARPAIYYSGKIKVRRSFEDAIFLHQFAFSYGWDTDDKWNQRTSFYTDRALSENLLFRFANDGDWFISRGTFQSSHGPTLAQTVNKYNSVSYNVRYSMGILNGYYQHVASDINIHWRHGTPSKKIYIDLIPALTYPLATDFTEVRSFQIRFEYLFGDIK
jgi:hypothetical protein